MINGQVSIYLFGAMMVAVSGCAQPTQSEIKFLETRELELPYDEAYSAALNAMFGMGLSLQHTDKASGIITGQSGDHVQRASTHPLFRGLCNVTKVTLMLASKAETTTQLRMKVLVNEKQQLDRTLMTKIWQAIEREAMLETRPATPAKSEDRPSGTGHAPKDGQAPGG